MIRWLFFLCCTATFAQSPQSAASKWYDAVYNIDIDAVLAQSCLPNNAENYAALDEVFQSTVQKIRFSLTSATYKVGDEFRHDGKRWVPITYRNVIRVTFFNKLPEVQVVEKKMALQQAYNATSITYEKQRNAFLIVYTARLVGVHDGADWKVFPADNTFLSSLFQPCIPQEVREQFQW